MTRGTQVHLRIYLTFVGFFVALWALTGGGYFWPVWPALGWGLAVATHGIVASGRKRRHGSEPPRLPEPVANRKAADPEHKRRWVTVMFTDLVGSTSLNEAVGDEEWSRFLAQHRALVRSAFLERGGTEVGTQGDGLLARFASPADAVLCAIDIQRRIEEDRASGTLVPRLRIGVHAGEAVDSDGDIVGRVVNLAARVTSEASPGEILITEPVADQLVGRIELEDRGLRALRGVPQPRHLLAVRWS
jgi:class 3 adenylate cyclase